MQKSSLVEIWLVSKYAFEFRNSHWFSVEKTVLNNFAIFTGKLLCWILFLTKLQAFFSHSDWIRVSYCIQFWCGKKFWKKNCGSFRSLWLWLLIAIMKISTEWCALQLYWTSLIHVHSKSRVTENIFNLQEWHQNTNNSISYKTFTDGEKTKTCQE